MARLQQANPSPEAEAAMAYLRVATALVEEKSAASKSMTSSSSRHSRSRSNRPAHIKPSEVLAADGHRPSTFNVVLDNPCSFHKEAIHTV
jgi:hypothetical protein